MRKKYIGNRIQTGEYIGEIIYTSGLVRIVEYLLLDLSDLLEIEGRRFGIVLSYLDSIYQACKKMDLDKDDETSEKIIYLYKPLIIYEFKRLCKKHLSKADSVIVLIHKLLEIIKEVHDFPYQREIETINKIIGKLYDNIKNKSKTTNLNYMTELIKEYMEQGLVGKYSLDRFSILEEEEKRLKTEMEGSGIRLKTEPNKILEVTWKEE